MMHDYLKSQASARRVAILFFVVVLLFFWSAVSAQTREGKDMYVPITKSLVASTCEEPGPGT
jgi:hypothetical protein